MVSKMTIFQIRESKIFLVNHVNLELLHYCTHVDAVQFVKLTTVVDCIPIYMIYPHCVLEQICVPCYLVINGNVIIRMKCWV